MLRPFSDHFPICLESLVAARGKAPFRFENMWLEHEGFSDLIREWWGELQVQGFASYVVASKLKHLKEKLKVWNRVTFGDIRVRKLKLLDSINLLDLKEESSGLVSEELEQRSEAKAEWAKVCTFEEISWRQKSRALWLQAGDRNTKYFHRIASLHRKFNSLSTIEVEGTRYDTLPAMKDAIFGFYRSLFTESEVWRPGVDDLSLTQLRQIDKETIELPFNEEEISRVLFECCGDKSPGPDGMTMAFIQSNWATLREDVLKLFDEFYYSGKFVASLNSTFIGLISKKVGAVNLKNFRPISLVGSMYKLLSKVLARRFRGVISTLISENQKRFCWRASDSGCSAHC